MTSAPQRNRANARPPGRFDVIRCVTDDHCRFRTSAGTGEGRMDDVRIRLGLRRVVLRRSLRKEIIDACTLKQGFHLTVVRRRCDDELSASLEQILEQRPGAWGRLETRQKRLEDCLLPPSYGLSQRRVLADAGNRGEKLVCTHANQWPNLPDLDPHPMFTEGLRPRFRVRRVAADERPVDIEQHRLELETHVTTRPLPGRVHVAMLCTVDAALASENVDSVTWNEGAARSRCSTRYCAQARCERNAEHRYRDSTMLGCSGVRRASCKGQP